MNIPFARAFAFLAVLVVAPLARPQAAQFNSLGPSVTSSTPSSLAASVAAQGGQVSAASHLFSPVTAAANVNRARTLGNTPSGSGTRYFAAADSDIANLSPRQVAERLVPKPVSAGDGVRKLEISIDLKRPLLIEAPPPSQSLNIGSAEIKGGGGYRDVEVQASIFLSGIETIRR